MRPVGRYHQRGAHQPLAAGGVRDAQLRGIGLESYLVYARRTGEFDALSRVQGTPQHGANVPVAHRLAERFQLVLGGFEPRESEVTRIRYVDAADGARSRGDLLPD